MGFWDPHFETLQFVISLVNLLSKMVPLSLPFFFSVVLAFLFNELLEAYPTDNRGQFPRAGAKRATDIFYVSVQKHP